MEKSDESSSRLSVPVSRDNCKDRSGVRTRTLSSSGFANVSAKRPRIIITHAESEQTGSMLPLTPTLITTDDRLVTHTPDGPDEEARHSRVAPKTRAEGRASPKSPTLDGNVKTPSVSDLDESSVSSSTKRRNEAAMDFYVDGRLVSTGLDGVDSSSSMADDVSASRLTSLPRTPSLSPIGPADSGHAPFERTDMGLIESHPFRSPPVVYGGPDLTLPNTRPGAMSVYALRQQVYHHHLYAAATVASQVGPPPGYSSGPTTVPSTLLVPSLGPGMAGAEYGHPSQQPRRRPSLPIDCSETTLSFDPADVSGDLAFADDSTMFRSNPTTPTVPSTIPRPLFHDSTRRMRRQRHTPSARGMKASMVTEHSRTSVSGQHRTLESENKGSSHSSRHRMSRRELRSAAKKGAVADWADRPRRQSSARQTAAQIQRVNAILREYKIARQTGLKMKDLVREYHRRFDKDLPIGTELLTFLVQLPSVVLLKRTDSAEMMCFASDIPSSRLVIDIIAADCGETMTVGHFTRALERRLHVSLLHCNVVDFLKRFRTVEMVEVDSSNPSNNLIRLSPQGGCTVLLGNLDSKYASVDSIRSILESMNAKWFGTKIRMCNEDGHLVMTEKQFVDLRRMDPTRPVNMLIDFDTLQEAESAMTKLKKCSFYSPAVRVEIHSTAHHSSKAAKARPADMTSEVRKPPIPVASAITSDPSSMTDHGRRTPPRRRSDKRGKRHSVQIITNLAPTEESMAAGPRKGPLRRKRYSHSRSPIVSAKRVVSAGAFGSVEDARRLLRSMRVAMDTPDSAVDSSTRTPSTFHDGATLEVSPSLASASASSARRLPVSGVRSQPASTKSLSKVTSEVYSLIRANGGSMYMSEIRARFADYYGTELVEFDGQSPKFFLQMDRLIALNCLPPVNDVIIVYSPEPVYRLVVDLMRDLLRDAHRESAVSLDRFRKALEMRIGLSLGGCDIDNFIARWRFLATQRSGPEGSKVVRFTPQVSSTVYFGNLSVSVSEDDIYADLVKIDERWLKSSVRLKMGNGFGYAFVDFPTRDDALRAVEIFDDSAAFKSQNVNADIEMIDQRKRVAACSAADSVTLDELGGYSSEGCDHQTRLAVKPETISLRDPCSDGSTDARLTRIPVLGSPPGSGKSMDDSSVFEMGHTTQRRGGRGRSRRPFRGHGYSRSLEDEEGRRLGIAHSFVRQRHSVSMGTSRAGTVTVYLGNLRDEVTKQHIQECLVQLDPSWLHNAIRLNLRSGWSHAFIDFDSMTEARRVIDTWNNQSHCLSATRLRCEVSKKKV